MKIEFIGGARTVTGSSFIIKDDDFTIMIDCGMFQGNAELRERNMLSLIYDPSKIDALIVTHAHIDHSGLIPKLVKEGFYGNIYSTKATADLASIMLPDSAHIQEMDVKWINRKNKKLNRDLVEPLYTVKDAEDALENFVPVSLNEKIQIHPRIEIRFREAGHILGSSFVEIWVEEDGKQKKIVFSGDLGPKDQAIIKDPDVIDDADILLIESTYGDRVHKDRPDTYKEFKEIILDSYNKSGNIIIPAFAIERTQEIIYTLGRLFRDGELPEIPVYIDSPLAISATEIFRKNRDSFDEETWKILESGNSPLNFPSLTFVKSAEESKKLNETAKGSIIISASGMCTAGRIKFHLANNLYKLNSSIIFVGYQAEGTLGRKIVDGAKQVKVYGEDVSVNAKIYTLGGFSGHADRDGLIDWMSHIKNPDLKVFIIHGEEKVALNFADTIKEKLGHFTYIPKWGEILDLNTMNSQMATYGISDSYSEIDYSFDSLKTSMDTLLAKYKRKKDANRLHNTTKLKDEFNDANEMISMIINDL